MKNIWSERTTIIAVIGAIGFIVLLLLLIFKVIAGADFGIAAGSWSTGITTAIGWFASDRKNQQ